MKKQDAILAIVIPVYNRAGIVERTLASLAAQTLRPLHIVLVDNASTDSTYMILQDWKNTVQTDGFIVDILQCPVPGAAAARNMGFTAVNEPWTMFFDSDDIMPPTHAEKVVSHINGADVIGWDVEEISGSKRRILTFVHSGREHYDNLFHGGMATQRWAARTGLFRSAGGWNETVRYWDDIELGARVLALNPRITAIGRSGIIKVTDSATITNSALGKPEMSLNALRLIEGTLTKAIGARKAKLWCATKLAIECGVTDRNGCRTGKRLLLTLPAIPTSAKWAYLHTRSGLPGAARILKRLNIL